MSPRSGWYRLIEDNQMSTATGKSDSKPVQSVKPNSVPKTGTVLAEFMRGIAHVPVMFINSKWDTGTEGDRWIVILPIRGELKAVETGLKGYVQKSDLREMGLALLSNPERAAEHFTSIPVVDDTEAARQISMLLPVMSL